MHCKGEEVTNNPFIIERRSELFFVYKLILNYKFIDANSLKCVNFVLDHYIAKYEWTMCTGEVSKRPVTFASSVFFFVPLQTLNFSRSTDNNETLYELKYYIGLVNMSNCEVRV